MDDGAPTPEEAKEPEDRRSAEKTRRRQDGATKNTELDPAERAARRQRAQERAAAAGSERKSQRAGGAETGDGAKPKTSSENAFSSGIAEPTTETVVPADQKGVAASTNASLNADATPATVKPTASPVQPGPVEKTAEGQTPNAQPKPQPVVAKPVAVEPAQKPTAFKAPEPTAVPAAPPPDTTAKKVAPVARPARTRRRHWGLLLTFLLFVVAPIGATAFYLWQIAEDQYSSVTGFTVRQEESSGASELLGGLAQLTGSQTSSDGDILYEFIRSQALVREVDERVGLREHYTQFWTTDPVFSLWPDNSIEDLEWFWQRVVRISYDQRSGLIEVRVLAFDADKAQTIAKEIVRQSQDMINALNTQAREDAMRYAREDLADAVERLKQAREQLTSFRTRTQIVDPEADIQGRMGVMNNLQQQLAEALIELDLLAETTNANDPRLVQARRLIEVIRARIRDERSSFASDSSDNGSLGEDYPTLIAEFEGLVVDREFAEQSYTAALAALDVARAEAARQSRYLSTYVEPTLAEESEYPQRFVIFGLAAFFLLLSWSVMALIYYSIRDRS